MNEEVLNESASVPRILGRTLAQETTAQELEEALGRARPTWTLRYPPDHD
jgi:hypothetical protein